MVSSKTAASPAPSSGIANVPYDVLHEIFLHCLPEYPLEDDKSKSIIMSLCWVCSTWRIVALSSPSLWSHLSLSIKVHDISSGSEIKWAILKAKIEFIQWWRNNQGSIAPYLSIFIEEYENYELDNIDDEDLDEGSTDVLLTYLASAQYLHPTDILHREELQKKKELAFPNLHTLVIKPHNDFDDDENSFEEAYTTLGMTSTHIASPLQHLHLSFDYDGELLEYPIIPHAYPALTHISLCCANRIISHRCWYALLSALPLLQWAYFEFDIEDEDGTATSEITECTLPHLTTFYLGCEYFSCNVAHVFSPALHLPALHTLSIYAPSLTYGKYNPVKGLDDIFRFMPNLTTLSLGGELFSTESSERVDKILSAPDNAPIWNRTPHLIDLQFELPFMNFHSLHYAEKRLEYFIDNAIHANLRWLGLDNPACPIRTITVIDNQLDNIQGFAEGEKRDVAAKFPGIDFRIAKKSMGQIASTEWKEWGARVRA